MVAKVPYQQIFSLNLDICSLCHFRQAPFNHVARAPPMNGVRLFSSSLKIFFFQFPQQGDSVAPKSPVQPASPHLRNPSFCLLQLSYISIFYTFFPTILQSPSSYIFCLPKPLYFDHLISCHMFTALFFSTCT